MNPEYYCHRSTGWLQFDPLKGTKHFEAWWALLVCDDEIPRYYGWFSRRWGVPLELGSRWRTHISVIKGEKPQRMPFWGRRHKEKVEFFYSNVIRWDNGKHAWLDVFSPQLSAMRLELGLRAKETYHLTIGRLEVERDAVPHIYDKPRFSKGLKNASFN